ncbi:MAG: hypothetical protein ACYTHJ_06410 [Planctomycetota bacterium]|jgi:hypothetical protein
MKYHDTPWKDDGGDNASLSTEAIFRQLIEDEIRNGRLSRSRRKRIVRYAAQLRLSAVDAGKMIEECRQRLAEAREQSPADSDETPPLTFVPVEKSEPTIPATVWKIWLIIVAAIIFDLLMLKWFAA